MRDLWLEMISLWGQMKKIHKRVGIGLFALLLLGVGLLSFSSSPPLLLLYPEGSLLPNEKKEIESWLKKSKVSFQEKPGVGLLVPINEAPRVRLELSTLGMPNKSDASFDFLDKGSWLRGERELQLLEMKAIKGQLEKDIASFDFIRSAKVFLDMGSGSRLRAHAKPKASVLLTVEENIHPSSSTIFAIAEHVASALPGLEVNRIAISDTKGKIYQTIGEMSPINEDEPLLFEEKIRGKIEGLLSRLVGNDHYFVESSHDQSSGRLGLAILIDENKMTEVLREGIEEQVGALTAPYTQEVTFALSTFQVDEKKILMPAQEKRESSFPWELLAMGTLFLFVSLSFFFLARWLFNRKKKDELEELDEEEDLDYVIKDVKEEILTDISFRRDKNGS